MAAPLARVVVLATSPEPQRRLAPFVDVLKDLDIELVYANTTKESAGIVFRNRNEAQGLILDVAPDAPGSFIEQIIGELRTTLPFLAPVVVTTSPETRTVVRAFRAGAGDVIDLAAEGRAELFVALERMSRDYVKRSGVEEQETELRSILDEFLRDLVQTEARAMDLETELASATRQDTDFALDIERQPTILVVDSDRHSADKMTDRLEDSGVITYAFMNGEEAVVQAELMASRGQPIDMVVVDQSLPGIDGLETIRRMRDPVSDAPFFLMTARSSAELAEAAADLGVAGYIIKPISDLSRLVNRLREQAIESQSRQRQSTYLDRIKVRHQSVLQRYRALTIEADLPPE